MPTRCFHFRVPRPLTEFRPEPHDHAPALAGHPRYRRQLCSLPGLHNDNTDKYWIPFMRTLASLLPAALLSFSATLHAAEPRKTCVFDLIGNVGPVMGAMR